MNSLIDQVISVIARELGEHHLTANRLSEIKSAYLLDDDLGCNSLDRVIITCALEEEFGIEISDDVAEKWQAVADIATSVSALREAA